ncbi:MULTISPECIES: hypothetical protein [unclassified Halorubrum]|uniref:hypothetical protein n=1 Tax=unclassified Halorubrum TaxID=2642239 RepID=UPI000B97E454|nr:MULTISPECIES: hypothetical protein [unclassified Halorubrum]OYR50217.1 hypothetical protein DJ74_06630 [Halorubrum sp. Ea8]OYR53171.1 hypothetical protein DJ73_08640 [Halorubrum sp. Ea1]
MISRARVLATVFGVLIGAYEGIGWAVRLGAIPVLKHTPLIIPILLGALVYGGIGFRYGVLGAVFAVVMLVVDLLVISGLKQASVVAIALWFLLPFTVLLWGSPFVPSRYLFTPPRR